MNLRKKSGMVKMRELGGEKMRKSVRISALEQAKEEAAAAVANNITCVGNINNNNINGTSTATATADNKDVVVGPITYQRRRVPKRKSLDQVGASTSSLLVSPPPATLVPQQEDLEEEEEEERVNSSVSTGDKPENLPSDHQSWMPEKRILELILDILQRRDTHELFADPVDPKEVVGYDEIIDEPMDFGTIRAKLKEDMYRTLQEFERDVFLVSRNAMNFNSSATIYFRQARAIHELAKRVFLSVRNNPSEIEHEFSVEKRRPGRKPRGGTQTRGGIFCNARPKGRPSNVRPCRGRASFNSNSSANPSGGCRYSGSGVNLCDRRLTYRAWTCLLGDRESIASTISDAPKQLHFVNEGIGYRESLDRFVKDLGPTAKKVAVGKVVPPPVTMLWPQRTLILQQTALSSDNQLGDRKGKNAITADHHHHHNTHGGATCGHPNWTTPAAGMRNERLNIGIICSSSNRMPIDIAAAKPTPLIVREPNSAPCRDTVIHNGDRADVVRAVGDYAPCLTQYTNNNNNKFSLHSLVTGVEGFLGPTTEDASGKYQIHHHVLSSRENQIQLNVAGTINYLTEGRSLTDHAYTNNYLSKQVHPAPIASGGILELMYRSRKGTKASVHPSVIVKPSSFSQTSSLWPSSGSGSGSGSSSRASLVPQESLGPPPYMEMEQQQQQYIPNEVGVTTAPFPLFSYPGLLEQGATNNIPNERPLLGRQQEELQLSLANSYKQMNNDTHLQENPHNPNYHVLLGCQTHNQLQPNAYVHQENSWDHHHQQQQPPPPPPSDVNREVQEAQLVGYSYVVDNIANSVGLETFMQQQRIFGATSGNVVHAAGLSSLPISLQQAAGTNNNNNNNIAPQLWKYGQHYLMGPDLDLQLGSKPPSPPAL